MELAGPWSLHTSRQSGASGGSEADERGEQTWLKKQSHSGTHERRGPGGGGG